MNLEIIIKHNSRETIFEQIVSQIKLLIAKEELRIGDSLPSIRKLAQALQVSVISVQRAYDELQSDGVIETVPGKGCYIARQVDAEFMKEEFYGKIEESMKRVVCDAKENNVSKEELCKLVEMFWDN